MTALLMVLIALTGPSGEAVQGRLRPPEAVTCDRNRLTAFSGTVAQWSRDDAGARLTLDTDAETRERFSLQFEKGRPPDRLFLLGGNAFRSEDWAKVEVSRGRVRPGMRATVWVCEGSANPIVDWRLPPT